MVGRRASRADGKTRALENEAVDWCNYTRGKMKREHKIHASIVGLRDGYKVTVSITEQDQTRELIARTVPSRFEAETIAKAFASHYDVPWYKVEVSSG